MEFWAFLGFTVIVSFFIGAIAYGIAWSVCYFIEWRIRRSEQTKIKREGCSLTNCKTKSSGSYAIDEPIIFMQNAPKNAQPVFIKRKIRRTDGGYACYYIPAYKVIEPPLDEDANR